MKSEKGKGKSEKVSLLTFPFSLFPFPFSLFPYFWVFPSPAVPAQAHDAEEGFAEDATRHLAGALAPVDENDADLLDLESNLIGCVLHLNLEAIALEANLV